MSWKYLTFEVALQLVIVMLFMLLPSLLGGLATLWGCFLGFFSISFIREKKETPHKSTAAINAFQGFMIIAFGVSLILKAPLAELITLVIIVAMLLFATVHNVVKEHSKWLQYLISFIVTLATCGYMIYRLIQ